MENETRGRGDKIRCVVKATATGNGSPLCFSLFCFVPLGFGLGFFLGVFLRFGFGFVLENLPEPWRSEHSISHECPSEGLALGHLDTDFCL